MIIGIPKEIKDNENRVGCTPAMVKDLVDAGHRVFIEQTAGNGSGFGDSEYLDVGAEIRTDAATVYSESQMIIKVKEPLPLEYPLLREGQILFTYLHLAADRELTEGLLRSKSIGIAYETVLAGDGSLPLLVPMSEIAGRMAAHIGAYYLAKPNGGPGVLMQGAPGVPAAKILILGGGTVGFNAAQIAGGMGGDITLLELNPDRIRFLDNALPKNVKIVMSNRYNLIAALKEADLVIGAVLIPGAKTPCLVSRDMLKYMKQNSVIVDVAVDQGGCIETTRPTTHSNPTYVVDGVLHYAVANMPGAFARTATIALTNATLPYALYLANLGPEKALAADAGLLKGLNAYRGKLACPQVAECHHLDYSAPSF